MALLVSKTKKQILRKLALQRCELELLRSHPKDERGSVREIGLWDRMGATLHFLELSPLTLWWEWTHCAESALFRISFSKIGPEMDPKRDRKRIPKRVPESWNPETGTRKLELETRSSNSIVELEFLKSKSNSNSDAKPS